MISLMIAIFVLGYACIVLEHKIKIDKAASALVMFGLIWSAYALIGEQTNTSSQLMEHLGSTCETLLFLIGAMTIVDLIDMHGGFYIITKYIKTRSKFRLLWLMAGITFFMSAVLDNMTTTIVMIMMLRKIIAKPQDRWIFSGIIIIAANSGGAWSPIGDVTTIMLWMRGNVTTIPLITYLILPCLASLFIPLLITSFKFRKSHGNYLSHQPLELRLPQGVGKRFSRGIFVVGVLGLISVPIFKTITGLPPYVGVMFVLGGLWVLTEIIYGRKRDLEESIKNRVSKVLKHIDMPTILFFLGILMSVAGLQSAGILGTAADFLDKNIHEVFTISTTVGVLSSVVDNVPLVAACMGMYPVALPDVIAASADPAYMQAFAQDGLFWMLLTYCAGVGGSILIIGSAAGVIAMGLEKIDFGWYLKNVSLIAFLGYIAGVLIIYLESLLFM
ncbi:MAG: sodium:proton antiporter NhaD [Bacteroidales bacterium]|nr:sodium:proton antiporter NhaD [Bacteroidales bacterium]